MKLHKLISRTVLATALLGATIGGSFVGINNVNAGTDGSGNSAPNTQGNASTVNTENKISSQDDSKGKTSNTATTRVPDGFLTLDSVPIMNFGSGNNGDSNNTSNVRDNPNRLTLNNENNGVLRITDYRNIDKNNIDASKYSGQTGWQLSVSMGQFNNETGYTSPLNNNDWSMQLNNSASYDNIDAKNGNNDASGVNFYSQKLNTDNNSLPLLKSDSSKKGYGVNEITYDKNNDATLDIPNVPQGNYSANMNWTLSTSLNSYNTDSNYTN